MITITAKNSESIQVAGKLWPLQNDDILLVPDNQPDTEKICEWAEAQGALESVCANPVQLISVDDVVETTLAGELNALLFYCN